MNIDKNSKILVIGLGLIGGSIAQGLKKKGYFIGGIDVCENTINYAFKNDIISVGKSFYDKEFIKDFNENKALKTHKHKKVIRKNNLWRCE